MAKKGRPRKYMETIRELDPDRLYTPALIAELAMEKRRQASHGPKENAKTYQRDYTRVRIALGRWSNNHQFPAEGDGTVMLKGRTPYPGWFGWRWQ